MFEPIRGGTRGGQAEFKWSDVSADKDRENYLGHSINAPTGRWQKNKDIHWYNRDKRTDAEKEEEIRKIKEAEAEALATALGFASGSTSAVKVPSGAVTGPDQPLIKSDGQHASEKEDKRRKKAERKEEKKARKEKHRESRHDEYERRRRGTRSRSRSPRPGKHEDHGRRPFSRRSRSPPPPASRHAKSYDEVERERERDRDRRRWDLNQREKLGTHYGRD